MKLIAKLIGVVTKWEATDDTSYVTMRNMDTGDVFEANARTIDLSKKGISQEGDKFEIIVQEDDEGKKIGEIKKISDTDTPITQSIETDFTI